MWCLFLYSAVRLVFAPEDLRLKLLLLTMKFLSLQRSYRYKDCYCTGPLLDLRIAPHLLHDYSPIPFTKGCHMPCLVQCIIDSTIRDAYTAYTFHYRKIT